MKNCFGAADILLPDFSKVEGRNWAVIACDQFTSEPVYWAKAKQETDGQVSTLNLILPEVYLSEAKNRVPEINRTMQAYLSEQILTEHKDAMIYLERTQSDGRVRHGIIGKIDLEQYDYATGADSLVRATEQTVLERIPPRVAIRRNAPLELPHVMVLFDDPEQTVIEPLATSSNDFEIAYDFDLMLGGGHVCGKWIPKAEQNRILESLDARISSAEMSKLYGADHLSPLLFAVGDGNHSLAAAKAAYEEIKQKIGIDQAKNHPARYALVEIVNLHDPALHFEPIYRVLFQVDPQDVVRELEAYSESLNGNEAEQNVQYFSERLFGEVIFKHPSQQLAVGTLQKFLDEYISRHAGARLDYIHGTDSVRALSEKADAIGFLFGGMEKSQLFRTVIYDGVLPRKTFSMGHAEDKRYYLECRKIK